MRTGHYDFDLDFKKQMARMSFRNAIRTYIEQFEKDNRYPFIGCIENFSDEEVIHEFLDILNTQYNYQLSQNRISKGYALSLTGSDNENKQIPILTTIKGLTLYLSNNNKNPIFHAMNIDLSACTMNAELLSELCGLIKILDISSLNILEINLPELDVHQHDLLKMIVSSISHTQIKIRGDNWKLTDILILEGINQVSLLRKDNFTNYFYNIKNIDKPNDLSSQPSIFTQGQINALLDNEVTLNPVKIEVGVQQQHRFEQQFQHNTETQFKQSWQIEQMSQSKMEKQTRFDHFYKENVVSWENIRSALDANDANHIENVNRVGNEIIQYRYKNRDLKDLWCRLTGDLNISKPEGVDVFQNGTYKFNSASSPKQISVEALLMIVRHPHLFQDGVNVHCLPDSFCYHELHGALFLRAKDLYSYKEQPIATPLNPQIKIVKQPDRPIAIHADILLESNIPARAFYHSLINDCGLNEHQAFLCWQEGFAALNQFNAQGMIELRKIITSSTPEDKNEIAIYLIAALNHYHIIKMRNQSAEIFNDQIQFEYQQKIELEKGNINALPMDIINSIAQEDRNTIHEKIIISMMQPLSTTHAEDEKNTYSALLLQAYIRNASLLPKEIQNQNTTKGLTKEMMDIIGHQNCIKMIELSLSQDISVVFNVICMLEAIHRVWGEQGLSEFSRCFLLPSLNFSEFSSDAYKNAINQLLSLNKDQYHWWQQLNLQHEAESGNSDFLVNMNAFQYFIEELSQLHLQGELPMPCPLQGIINMQVGLCRVITVIKQATNPSEQLRNLDKLDWGVNGIIQINRKDYAYYTAEMQINGKYEIELKKFVGTQEFMSYQDYSSYNGNPFYLMCIEDNFDSKDNEAIFKFSLAAFYRYIASRKYSAPMNIYREMISVITLPNKYSLIEKTPGQEYCNRKFVTKLTIRNDLNQLITAFILPVIAYATTGERNLDLLPRQESERRNQVSDFIQTVYKYCLEYSRYPDMQNLLSSHQAIEYQRLVKTLQESAILAKEAHLTLPELTLILNLMIQAKDICKENDQDLPSTFLQFTYTKDGFKHHYEYFYQGILRIQQYSTMHYVDYLQCCKNFIKNQNLSAENKGYLIRLMSLVSVTDVEIRKFDEFENLLNELKIKTNDDKLFSNGLRLLSCLVAKKNEKIKPITLAGLKEFITQCTLDINHLNKKSIESRFSDFTIDETLGTSSLSEFFANAKELDKSFPGLGIYFEDIKTIIKKYPQQNIEQQKDAYLEFLDVLMNNMESVSSLLKSLKDGVHQDVELSSINLWLNLCADSVKNISISSVELLNHKSSKLFCIYLNKYLQDTKYLQSNPQGYIKLLNKLAEIPGAEDHLETFHDAVLRLHHLLANDIFDWVKTFEELIDSVKAKLDLISVISYLSSMVLKEQDRFPHVRIVMLKWIANPVLIINIQQTTNIYNAILILDTHPDLDLMGLRENELATIAEFYKSFPLPNEARIKDLLAEKINLNEFCESHMLDPYAERDEHKLNQQFSNDNIWSYLDKITSLDDTQKYKYYEQLTFCNVYGRQEYRKLSLLQIRETFADIHRALSQKPNSKSEIELNLHAFALLREAIYKQKHIWLSPIQTLAFLALANESEHDKSLFFKMAAGEGKSILGVIQAVYLWLQGDPVAIVAHRSSFAYRDAESFAGLFAELGIDSRYLTTNQKIESSKELTGIYFADFSNITLIHLQLIENTGTGITKMSFIIDEADKSILHNPIDNNLTESVGDSFDHIYGWVFEAMAEYIENMNPEQVHKIRIRDVVNHLKRYNPSCGLLCQQPDFLSKLTIYLEAVWQASSLKDKNQYIEKVIDKQNNIYFAAVLQDDEAMQFNVTFDGLVQQGLHAILNHKYKKEVSNKRFRIAPETRLCSSMNTYSALKWMQKSGKVIFMSATIGLNSQSVEMEQKLGLKYYKLPKKHASNRTEYPVNFCKNQQEQFAEIGNICNKYINETQKIKCAIIISVETIEMAETLKDQLQSYHPTVLHAGIEDLDENKIHEIENQKAGVAGHVLIAVGGFVTRAFDAKLTTAREIIFVGTFITDETDRYQEKCRASRTNPNTGLRDKGKYFSIYDLERECIRYPGLENSTADLDVNPELFIQRQYHAYYQQESFERKHNELKGIVFNSIQQHYFGLWEQIKTNPSISIAMRKSIQDNVKATWEKTINILPPVDFSTSAVNRDLYNQQIINLYMELLQKIHAEVGNIIDVNVDNIYGIKHFIYLEQAKLIQIYDTTMNLQPVQPGIRIHKKWKQGVNYNAYLDSGKQGTFNYLVSMFGVWSLPEDKRQQLEDAKQTSQTKIVAKRLAASHFISAIHQLETNKIQIDEIKKDVIHPVPFTIMLACNDTSVFLQLQNVINEHYEYHQIKDKLNYRIEKNADHFQLILDFCNTNPKYKTRSDFITSIASRFLSSLSPEQMNIIDFQVNLNIPVSSKKLRSNVNMNHGKQNASQVFLHAADQGFIDGFAMNGGAEVYYSDNSRKFKANHIISNLDQDHVSIAFDNSMDILNNYVVALSDYIVDRQDLRTSDLQYWYLFIDFFRGLFGYSADVKISAATKAKQFALGDTSVQFTDGETNALYDGTLGGIFQQIPDRLKPNAQANVERELVVRNKM